MKKSVIAISALMCLEAISWAQDQVTVEWIYDQERIDRFSIPNYQWLDDGNLILLNKRDAISLRTFQKYFPNL